MPARAPESRLDIGSRAALALARARPEDVPRVVAGVLKAAFAGARCDVLARRRAGDRRTWVAVATRPAPSPALRAGEGGGLPAAGLHEVAAGAESALPGGAHLRELGLSARLAWSVRTPEVKALLSVARAEPFTAEEADCLRRLGPIVRGPLVTWARLERFRRTLQRARFLHRLLGDTTRSMDAAELATSALRRLREQLPADRLTLVEPSDDPMELVAWTAEPGRSARIERHVSRATAKALRLGLQEGAVFPDPASFPADPWFRAAAADGMGCLLVLPLQTSRRHAGGIILAARAPGALGTEHLPLLFHVARPLASAIERAQLFREAGERTRQMTALYEVGQALSSPLDTAGVTERVLSALHDAFRFRHSAVLTLQSGEDGDWLVMQASRGYSVRDDRGFRMRVGDRGVTSRAVRSGRIVYVPDVREDPHYVPGIESGRSEVAVPLIVGGKVVGVLDVESTEVNGFTARDIDTLKLFSTQVGLAIERARTFDDVRRQAMTDGLSGLLNQRYFKQKVDREIDRSRRTGRPFALALIDVDDFKSVNDRHGHVVGDQVIGAMGEALRARVRSIDAAARFGGDEFALILSEADLGQGLRVAEDVRADVAALRPAGVDVSLSIGVAEWTPALGTFRDVVNAADRALYRAKALGKGRVEAAPAEEP